MTTSYTTHHDALMDHDVIVMTKTNCVQCTQTKKVLTRKGVSYHEIDLESTNTRLTDQDYTTPYEFCTQTLGAKNAPVVLVRTSQMDAPDSRANTYGDFTVWTGFRPDYLKSVTPTPVASVLA